jgi:putative SOS response-associated peptidase YedK
MCFTIKYITQKKLKYARRRGDDPQEINNLENELEDLTLNMEAQYVVSAFTHPQLLVFTNKEPLKPKFMRWGLIPFWVKDEKQANQIQNKTLNARIETIFQKPAFRSSAKSKRCLVMIDGFYEYHHFKGHAYPFYVYPKNEEPMVLSGLWDSWYSKDGLKIDTVTIVTTKGEGLMNQMHNNPKLAEPRMPLFLNKETEQLWLNIKNRKENLNDIMQAAGTFELGVYPVRALSGKHSVGNTYEATRPYLYPELQNIKFA